MRAAWYERTGAARDVLVVGEMARPEPGPDEVRVRLSTSGINPGDVKKRADWLGFGMPYPRVIPHSDGSGVIDAVGDDLPSSRLGERVWVWGAQSYRPFGTAAEFVTVPSERAVHLPDDVSFTLGACLGISARTAHRCVFADGSVEGRTILVAGGSGNVGSAAVSLAKWGSATVIATVGSSEGETMAREAGADHVLNYRSQDVSEYVAEITSGVGVDRIVEVALGANMDLDRQMLALGGTIAAYASDADPEPRLPFWPLLFTNATIRLVGSDDLPSDAEQAAVEAINDCLVAGGLRPRVGWHFPLEGIVEAHEAVERGHPSGHVILDIP